MHASEGSALVYNTIQFGDFDYQSVFAGDVTAERNVLPP